MKTSKLVIDNLTIKHCSFTDLVYYYRVKDGLTHKEASKKVKKICDFLNTDFGCSYRKDKLTGLQYLEKEYPNMYKESCGAES